MRESPCHWLRTELRCACIHNWLNGTIVYVHNIIKCISIECVDGSFSILFLIIFCQQVNERQKSFKIQQPTVNKLYCISFFFFCLFILGLVCLFAARSGYVSRSWSGLQSSRRSGSANLPFCTQIVFIAHIVSAFFVFFFTFFDGSVCVFFFLIPFSTIV